MFAFCNQNISKNECTNCEYQWIHCKSNVKFTVYFKIYFHFFRNSFRSSRRLFYLVNPRQKINIFQQDNVIMSSKFPKEQICNEFVPSFSSEEEVCISTDVLHFSYYSSKCVVTAIWNAFTTSFSWSKNRSHERLTWECSKCISTAKDLKFIFQFEPRRKRSRIKESIDIVVIELLALQDSAQPFNVTFYLYYDIFFLINKHIKYGTVSKIRFSFQCDLCGVVFRLQIELQLHQETREHTVAWLQILTENNWRSLF